ATCRSATSPASPRRNAKRSPSGSPRARAPRTERHQNPRRVPRARPRQEETTMSSPTNAPATAALAELSRLAQDAFVARLEGIFEHSPWIAERAWRAGPFASIDALHAAMCRVVDTADPKDQQA